ncbi:hypothetical protein CDCA_CDCA17G4409 [Cyanidium caldarium]|uniref:protein-histidine N-methyltransferase n=1 Tax=Cyanidium caldarium TaxID=2771 RepID=A0AAV9J236_CYACA|nr:hypothetical protein CDCA_CDCA17G4409 [Cyanidium caldarium]
MCVFRFHFGERQDGGGAERASNREATADRPGRVGDGEEAAGKPPEWIFGECIPWTDSYTEEHVSNDAVRWTAEVLDDGHVLERVALVRMPELHAENMDIASGYRVWEGARDLATYVGSAAFATEYAALVDTDRQSAVRAIEIGCGHALAGVRLAQRSEWQRAAGATVDFHDYNRRVITELTQRNVWRNAVRRSTAPSPMSLHRHHFFAGDWRGLPQAVAAAYRTSNAHRYDLVLASETAYTAAVLEACLRVCRQLLRQPHGVALLATKTCYFGLDGGSWPLHTAVRQLGGRSRCVWRSARDDRSYQREVIAVQFEDADGHSARSSSLPREMSTSV